MSEYPFEKILSHPPTDVEDGYLLLDHLEDVANRSMSVVPESVETVNGGRFDVFVSRLGWVHDFGKLTTWFQKHLNDEMVSGRKKNHSLIGGFAAFHVLSECGYSTEAAFAGFISVAKHHSRLTNPAGYVEGLNNTKPKLERVDEQVENIDRHAPELADKILSEASDGETGWVEFRDNVLDDSLLSDLREFGLDSFWNADRSILSRESYSLVVRTWSALVIADKTSAAGVPESALDGEYPSSTELEKHIQEVSVSSPDTELNRLREDARVSVLDQVEEFVESDSRIGSITLPTGIGKTFTGLNAALDIREQLATESDVPGRVVYALPYTSIIDQTAETITDDVFGVDETGEAVTIHHHLAETRTEFESEDDSDADAECMVAESWRSGIVTTTFVQLFESLAVPRNTQAMKLSSLYNSVIILDEPQALPVDWWPLVCELIRVLTEDFGAYVLLMTATQPSILETDPENELEAFRLVEDARQYYESLERVEFQLHESVKNRLEDQDADATDYEAAANELADTVGNGNSVLAICNTVKSARTLHSKTRDATDQEVVSIAESLDSVIGELGDADRSEYVKETFERVRKQVSERENGFVSAHLTTRIRPRDRRVILDVVEKLLDSGEIVVLTATQVVEAGVDISFGVVYRDFAPLDSIVQAAGRCNRNNERESGVVNIWRLKDPTGNGRLPSMIYQREGDNHLRLTREVFREIPSKNRFSETTVTIDGVQLYYEKLADVRPGESGWVSDLRNGNYSSIASKSIISGDTGVDVLIPRTESELADVTRVRTAIEESRYKEADNLLTELGECRVSVPVSEDTTPSESIRGVTDVIDIGEDGIVVVDSTHEGESVFDPITGVQKPE